MNFQLFSLWAAHIQVSKNTGKFWLSQSLCFFFPVRTGKVCSLREEFPEMERSKPEKTLSCRAALSPTPMNCPVPARHSCLPLGKMDLKNHVQAQNWMGGTALPFPVGKALGRSCQEHGVLQKCPGRQRTKALCVLGNVCQDSAASLCQHRWFCQCPVHLQHPLCPVHPARDKAGGALPLVPCRLMMPTLDWPPCS